MKTGSKAERDPLPETAIAKRLKFWVQHGSGPEPTRLYPLTAVILEH